MSSDVDAVDISGCICHPTSLFLIFRVGWPAEGFSEAGQGGAALLPRKLAGLMKDPGVSHQLGTSTSLMDSETLHEGTRLSSAAHQSLSQVQTVLGLADRG